VRPHSKPHVASGKAIVQTRRRSMTVQAATPTVADTKAKFFESFRKPLPGLYSGVIGELLVQQHLFRWNKSYSYNEVTALGITSIFNQVLEGLPEQERASVFDSFIIALQEDPAKYRADSAKLEEWAKGRTSGGDDVRPDSNGDDVQKALARIAEAATSQGQFLYTKFFAVGLFRLLELSGAKDPKALGALVSALGVPQERVNADLMTYKGILSKLQAAKEIMKEFIAREKKKAAEREAEKAAKAAAPPTEAA
jgi:photosystem II biogenesis protein Psp29